MEMHQARYFVALCETLNFTRAAEKCNVTQPSLTRAIKLLEEELGGPLFNRERNQTHLTELGRMMEPHLREVIEQARTARARASSFFALRTARLKLGVARGVSFHVLDETLAPASWPATPTPRSRCTTSARSSCARRLRRGDFEIVAAAAAHAGPRRSALLPGRRGPAVRDHAGGARRWRAAGTIALETLAEQPLVCGDGCPFWEAAERSFAEAGLSVTPKAIATRAEWLFELVGAGVGIGVAALHRDLPAELVARAGRGRGAGPRHQPHHQARPALLAAGQGVRRPGAQAAAEASAGRLRRLSEALDGGDDVRRLRAARPIRIGEGIGDDAVAAGDVGRGHGQLPAGAGVEPPDVPARGGDRGRYAPRSSRTARRRSWRRRHPDRSAA